MTADEQKYAGNAANRIKNLMYIEDATDMMGTCSNYDMWLE